MNLFDILGPVMVGRVDDEQDLIFILAQGYIVSLDIFDREIVYVHNITSLLFIIRG